MPSEPTTVKHVLIVEDEPDFAALLCSILAKAGYAVTSAYSCEDALIEVRCQKPDLITLDIRMPRKSGVLFYRKLKSYEQFRDIPVVVVTGLTRDDRDMEHVIHTFLEPDGLPRPEAYVEKPVDAAHLVETIRKALELRTSLTMLP